MLKNDSLEQRLDEIRNVLLVLALLERGQIEEAKAALINRLPATEQAYFLKTGKP